ncbi:MAG: hypothetical protein ACI89U_002082, partial [Gammaproteobacteria bacterium]
MHINTCLAWSAGGCRANARKDIVENSYYFHISMSAEMLVLTARLKRAA